MLTRWLQRQWFEQRRLSPALWLLLPLMCLFICLAALKRYLTKPEKLSVPVIVVGNITVGGAGKTPLTLWLAQQFFVTSINFWQRCFVPQHDNCESTNDQ